ncbi:hypothetical protein HQ576_14775, partial [bacterium]|nr:hypothetical protein [bacterium]
ALYGLDPQTGRVACHTTVRVRHPKGTEGLDKAPRKNFVQNATDGKTFAAPDQSDGFSMYAARSDVLVSDGTSIYLRQIRFDRNAVQQDTLGRHLFSTSRLLDGAENHRSHWVLGTGDFRRLPVAYSWIANGTKPRWGVRLAEPYGLMLAFDGHTAWGVRRGAVYTLYATANRPFSPGEKPRPDFRKGDDPSQWKATWQTNVPLRPRAIVRAGDAVLLGGTPGLGSTGKAFGAFEGREHGVLLVASAADGRTRATHKLAAPPVWDGMAVARGRLYLSTVDGKVVCWTGAP